MSHFKSPSFTKTFCYLKSFFCIIWWVDWQPNLVCEHEQLRQYFYRRRPCSDESIRAIQCSPWVQSRLVGQSLDQKSWSISSELQIELLLKYPVVVRLDEGMRSVDEQQRIYTDCSRDMNFSLNFYDDETPVLMWTVFLGRGDVLAW